MDLITIIWYFSTFFLLILFFVVMVCSDNICNRRRQNKPEDIAISAPPTPAPSYREFAPPGYDSVMKKYKNRIFIVPMENSSEPGLFSTMQPPPPISPISSSIGSPVVCRQSAAHVSAVPEVVVFQVENEQRGSASPDNANEFEIIVSVSSADGVNVVGVHQLESKEREQPVTPEAEIELELTRRPSISA